MGETIRVEERIFFEAIEIEDPEKRLEHIRVSCNGDTSLQQRISELVEFHDQDGNMLDITTDGDLYGELVEDSTVHVGAMIGPYKLLQPIGTGGMGDVFMAEQLVPVCRRVAIKIIKMGMDTRNVLARFDAERHALELMEHPNITKVYDAGHTESGRPFFVMELVSGLAITRYCDQNHLDLRNRLELFHKVCNGVQHAHQKGIIHRDLKPSNIMVTNYDGIPMPKIIDFGIAKAIDRPLTEQTLFTSYGNMVGTPEYMSPEQAEMSGLDIDTRSDVYALGVLLYELLTGTTPFYRWKQSGLHKFCNAICHEEAELASTRISNLAETVESVSNNRNTDLKTLNRCLRGDLDWILAKCLAKNRNDRYGTAADLARDIRSHLDGFPIEAASPSLQYRAGKYMRKHSTALTVVGTCIAALLCTTIISTVFAIRAQRAEALASSSLKHIDRLRSRAVAERDRAVQAEAKLQELNNQIADEAATASASLRFLQKYPGSKFTYYSLHCPTEVRPVILQPGDSQPLELAASMGTQRIGIRSASEDVSGSAISSPANDGLPSQSDIPNALSKSPQANRSPITRAMNIQIKGGDIRLTTGTPDAQIRQPGVDDDISVITIEGIDCFSRTHDFLNLLADEQRRLFGERNQRLVETKIKSACIAIENQDWELAEGDLRSIREVIRNQFSLGSNLNEVDILLSHTLLKQGKIREAELLLDAAINRLQSNSKFLPQPLVIRPFGNRSDLPGSVMPVDRAVSLDAEFQEFFRQTMARNQQRHARPMGEEQDRIQHATSMVETRSSPARVD